MRGYGYTQIAKIAQNTLEFLACEPDQSHSIIQIQKEIHRRGAYFESALRILRKSGQVTEQQEGIYQITKKGLEDVLKKRKRRIRKFLTFISEKEYLFVELTKKLGIRPKLLKRVLDALIEEGHVKRVSPGDPEATLMLPSYKAA